MGEEEGDEGNKANDQRDDQVPTESKKREMERQNKIEAPKSRLIIRLPE